jgi:GWxTD domain-containing protein
MKFVLFLVCVTLATPLAAARDLAPQYVKWLEREAVYIISNAENKEFNRLTTDTERDAFIEKFWKIRDTDSSTQENEFRKEHYERIRQANERFADGIPGWKTDRGRIWILHGPPDDVHYEYGGGSVGIDIEKPTAVLTEDANPDRRRSYRLSISKPETEIWLYRHIEGARNFPTYFQVIFSRTDPTQTYQLNQVLRQVASRASLDYAERVQRDAAIKIFLRGHFFGGPFRILYAGQYKFQDLDDFYQSIFHPLRLPMISVGDFHEGIQDLERSSGEVLMEKLALARAIREKVRSRIFFEELSITVRTGTLQAASGATVLPVSVGLPATDRQGHPIGSPSDTLDLLIEIVDARDEVKASLVDSVKITGGDQKTQGRSLYQTRLAAAPGDYRLRIYAALRGHPAAVSVDMPVTLPDYGAGLAMSDLLLFENMVPRDDFKKTQRDGNRTPRFLGRTQPVSLKNFVLIPSADGQFKRGQKLTAFFEVYNPSLAEGDKGPALRVRCRFKRAGGIEQELPEKFLDYMTESKARRTTYGISIPLLGFSTGDYSLEFDVFDSVQGKEIRKAASFTIY